MNQGRATACPPYCPPLAGTPGERVTAFVELARAMRRHGHGSPFEARLWDVTDTVARRAGVPARPGRLRVVFEDEGETGRAATSVAPFVRAYVAMLPTVGHTRLAACAGAGRLLARAMDARGAILVSDVTVAVLNDATVLARQLRRSGGGGLANAIGEIGEFLSSHGMTHAPLAGTLPPSPPPSLPARHEDSHAGRSRRLLPSDGFLDALAEAHAIAERTADVVVTRVALLLASAPVRINEALAIEEDPEVEREPGGTPVLGLRWRGSKGSGDGVKWIAPAMAAAVREACEDLRRVTAEGRRIKAWYAVHPTSLYLPPAFAHLRDKADLTADECGILLGRRPGPGLIGLMAALGSTGSSGLTAGPSFAAVEAHLLGLLPDMMRDAGGAEARPLLVVPWGTFDGRRRPSCPCMFQTVGYRHVADALRGPLFRRLGLDPEGAIGGRTHSFRHWLVTLALRGGMTAADVAAWCGRATPRANRAYDHRTAAEMRAMVRRGSAASRRTTSPLAAIAMACPTIGRTEGVAPP